jgi:hypothetical protein
MGLPGGLPYVIRRHWQVLSVRAFSSFLAGALFPVLVLVKQKSEISHSAK